MYKTFIFYIIIILILFLMIYIYIYNFISENIFLLSLSQSYRLNILHDGK